MHNEQKLTGIRQRVTASEPSTMASSVSPYEQKIHLVDAFEEFKFYFSKAHFLFLIQESLELTRGGPEKLKYILDLARRCKSGIVSIELLAKQIDHEYSLPPLLHEQEGEVNGGRAQGCGEMETENDGGGGEEDEEQDDQKEGEVRWSPQSILLEIFPKTTLPATILSAHNLLVNRRQSEFPEHLQLSIFSEDGP